jgi:ATP-dependent protease ClpP protease subunit
MKTIILSGDVGWELTPDALRDQLPSDGEDILIEVYSFGGDVFDGLEMYNIIKDYPGKVSAKIGALSASAATIFPCAADSIAVHKNSTEMIHNTWSIAVGNTDDMRKESEILAGLDGILADIYAERTGKSKEEILADMKNEKWLFGAAAIIEYGFADSVDSESEEETTIKPDSAKSELSAKVASIKARMRESGREGNDFERAAALLPKRGNSPTPQHDGSLDRFKDPAEYALAALRASHGVTTAPVKEADAATDRQSQLDAWNALYGITNTKKEDEK